MLAEVAPSVAVTLNHAVATAEAVGPEPAVVMVETLLETPNGRRYHRAHAVLGYLRERQGHPQEALACFREAARLATSAPEQRHLNRQTARLVGSRSTAGDAGG